MKNLVSRYTSLVDYQVADVTAASTFYIAEIYFNFSRSLLQSEKPDNLSDVELEEFNSMLEEQSFPFEEKAIKVHEKNIELLASGIFSTWIDRSIEKLAKLVPARFDKPEEPSDYISKIDNYIYSSPRYLREDASTGIIVDLDFFRYSSQNKAQTYHKNQAKGDIDNQASVVQGKNSPTVQEPTPQNGVAKTETGSQNVSNSTQAGSGDADRTGSATKAGVKPVAAQATENAVSKPVADSQKAATPEAPAVTKSQGIAPGSEATPNNGAKESSVVKDRQVNEEVKDGNSGTVHQSVSDNAPSKTDSNEITNAIATGNAEKKSLQPVPQQ